MTPDHPLSPNGTTHVLLDANALLPPRLSDILFDLCLQGLFSARWSAEIENEFLRNWPKVVAKAGKGGANWTASQQAAALSAARRRLDCYKGAVPDHEVFGHDAASVLARLPPAVHAGDKHVAAAGLILLDYALEFNQNDKVYIVSNNIKHLAVTGMKGLGVVVIRPGAFIDKLTQVADKQVGIALDKSVGSLKKPPYTRQLLLGALLVHGAKETATFFANAWGEQLPSIGAK